MSAKLHRWVCPKCGAKVQVIGSSASVGHECPKHRSARGAKVFTLFEKERTNG